MKTFYVLMSLDKNLYFESKADDGTIFSTKSWEKAKWYETKEEALKELKDNSLYFNKHKLNYWTTREFFQT